MSSSNFFMFLPIYFSLILLLFFSKTRINSTIPIQQNKIPVAGVTGNPFIFPPPFFIIIAPTIINIAPKRILKILLIILVSNYMRYHSNTRLMNSLAATPLRPHLFGSGEVVSKNPEAKSLAFFRKSLPF